MLATTTDGWGKADSYERYMGRWSRRLARQFLYDLAPAQDACWLDVGCGTGALTRTVLDRSAPRSIDGVDPSADFLALARNRIGDPRATFTTGDACNLPFGDGRFDIAVSGLALNFIPDRVRALAGMRRAVRPGGTIAYYVWDYPSGGVGFMDAFWKAAARLDPAAAENDEATRFGFCTEKGLLDLSVAAGLDGAAVTPLVIETRFADFADFFVPFTLGAGPAPAYFGGLDGASKARLRQSLIAQFGDHGPITLSARAWSVRAART